MRRASSTTSAESPKSPTSRFASTASRALASSASRCSLSAPSNAAQSYSLTTAARFGMEAGARRRVRHRHRQSVRHRHRQRRQRVRHRRRCLQHTARLLHRRVLLQRLRRVGPPPRRPLVGRSRTLAEAGLRPPRHCERREGGKRLTVKNKNERRRFDKARGAVLMAQRAGETRCTLGKER